MKLLHYFNPGYEPGLLPGNSNYTPPKNVVQMREELALLPLWYAEPEDCVWVEKKNDVSFLAGLPEDFPDLPEIIDRQTISSDTGLPHSLQLVPWGISPQCLSHFESFADGQLKLPVWKEAYRSLAGRQTAALCLDKIRALTSIPLPDTPSFLFSVEELEDFLRKEKGAFVLKVPYSSSGRGLLRIDSGALPGKEKEWITGALRKQGMISIERRLEKEQDIALEYYLNAEGQAVYKGVSWFETTGWKSYCGNLLASREVLEGKISSSIGESVFEEVKEITRQVIEEVFGGVYSGYLGVDMMIYRDPDHISRIHPCVEINMRYTMGMVAVRLFERFPDPSVTTARFRITYEKNAYTRNQEMREANPPVWKNGKLLKGYLPLCPVHPDTHYRAYVFIED